MSVLLGIILVVSSLATVILALHNGRRTTENAFLTLDSIHARQSEQLDKTIDRLMTIDWERFAAVHASEEADFGGFIAPEPDEQPVREDDTRWAQLRRLRFGPSEETNEELALLDEDFPDMEGAR